MKDKIIQEKSNFAPVNLLEQLSITDLKAELAKQTHSLNTLKAEAPLLNASKMVDIQGRIDLLNEELQRKEQKLRDIIAKKPGMSLDDIMDKETFEYYSS